MLALELQRRDGRDDYPIRPVWNSILSGVVSTWIESLRRELLRDSTRTMMKSVSRIRKLGLKNRMPFEPNGYVSKMNKLCVQMTFARRKKDSKRERKSILRKVKNLHKKVSWHAIKHFELLDKNLETVDISRPQAEQILKQISNVTGKLANVVRCAHEQRG